MKADKIRVKSKSSLILLKKAQLKLVNKKIIEASKKGEFYCEYFGLLSEVIDKLKKDGFAVRRKQGYFSYTHMSGLKVAYTIRWRAE